MNTLSTPACGHPSVEGMLRRNFGGNKDQSLKFKNSKSTLKQKPVPRLHNLATRNPQPATIRD
ncbi:hypothetical protein OQ279_05115 [Salinimicrobium sp. MT39]|uniref:Uncharacterized protein n=1 Tax=Salinimicrobium profundisediminis TaxID=2994553 RepID=A0A9X3CVL1_9FLAO|nr:hypothetical protein [Salinimicrobium profundisediminis]MCX2837526.1 hypothetical protein [Salinimicrobium profundisediminis]